PLVEALCSYDAVVLGPHVRRAVGVGPARERRRQERRLIADHDYAHILCAIAEPLLSAPVAARKCREQGRGDDKCGASHRLQTKCTCHASSRSKARVLSRVSLHATSGQPHGSSATCTMI